MGTKPKFNRVEQLTADQALVDGLTKYADKLSALMVGGAPVKVADVVAALNAEIAAENAVAPAKATWEAAVQAAKDQRAKTKATLTGVKQSIQLMFAGQAEALGDFGLKPRKEPAPRTPQQKAAAVAKAKATRAARGTMGTQQKKAVKGDVAGRRHHAGPHGDARVTSGGDVGERSDERQARELTMTTTRDGGPPRRGERCAPPARRRCASYTRSPGTPSTRTSCCSCSRGLRTARSSSGSPASCTCTPSSRTRGGWCRRGRRSRSCCCRSSR